MVHVQDCMATKFHDDGKSPDGMDEAPFQLGDTRHT